MVTPLITILEENASNYGKRYLTDPDDESWYNFVLDYKEKIIENSTIIAIDPDLFNEMAYDLTRFLISQRIPCQYKWIIYLINDIDTDADFTAANISGLKIPSESYMAELYKMYKSQDA